MDLLDQIAGAVAEPMSAIRPVTIYEANQTSDAALWAAIRRAKLETRDSRKLTRLKRIKRAVERDVVDQLRRLRGVTIYEHDNNGQRFPVELLGGFIRDELVGIIHGIPTRPLDHLAIVIDLVSVDEFAEASNAETNGINEHFIEWETMAGMFAQGANVPGAVLVLLCPRSGDMLLRIFDRDDDRIAARFDVIENMLELEGTPTGVRSALGSHPVAVTCRTCAHCYPMAGNVWKCERMAKANGTEGRLSESTQVSGAGCHIIHPALMPLEWLDMPTDGAAWYKANNGEIIEILNDDEPSSDASLCDRSIRSREAAALCGCADFFTDQNIDEIKVKFGGKIK